MRRTGGRRRRGRPGPVFRAASARDMSRPLPVLVDRLAACLRGERVVWHADSSVEQLIAACDDQGITALIHAHEVSGTSDWPEAARVRLSAEARAGAVQEVVR